MVLFTKNALCQSWKRIDKEKKKKKERKERMKSERLINGQPQRNKGKFLHIKIDTAYHLSGDLNTNENTSRNNNTSLWPRGKRWQSAGFSQCLLQYSYNTVYPIMHSANLPFSDSQVRLKTNTVINVVFLCVLGEEERVCCTTLFLCDLWSLYSSSSTVTQDTQNAPKIYI